MLLSRRGARNVLLVFFPFAFTGVCTGELRQLSDDLGAFDELDTDVLAVSCDSLPSLRAFADGENLELTLLSDFWPHGEVSASYGAFQAVLGAAGRSTYAIDRDGIVRWAVHNPATDPRNVADYLKALRAL